MYQNFLTPCISFELEVASNFSLHWTNFLSVKICGGGLIAQSEEAPRVGVEVLELDPPFEFSTPPEFWTRRWNAQRLAYRQPFYRSLTFSKGHHDIP